MVRHTAISFMILCQTATLFISQNPRLLPNMLPHLSWVTVCNCTMWHIVEWHRVFDIKGLLSVQITLLFVQIAPVFAQIVLVFVLIVPCTQRLVFRGPVVGAKWMQIGNPPQSCVDTHKDVHTWSEAGAEAKGFCYNFIQANNANT